MEIYPREALQWESISGQPLASTGWNRNGELFRAEEKKVEALQRRERRLPSLPKSSRNNVSRERKRSSRAISRDPHSSRGSTLSSIRLRKVCRRQGSYPSLSEVLSERDG